MGLIDQLKSLLEGKLRVNQRFEILREAVTGTMSSFYVVRDRRTGDIAGLKILDSEKTAFFESRFKGLSKPSEGEIARQIDHPRIVKTLESGFTAEGQPYILMEYLEGPVLHALVKDRSPLLERNRLTLIRQMAEAVGAVHDAGFIHRDICPRNFICNKKATELKLIDFGLTVPATREFMQPGNRTGTPSYMAPEVVRRRPTDQRLDIFSLGVTCYHICALELPWPGQDVSGMAAMLHDTQQPNDLKAICPWVHPQLAGAIMECLAIEPAHRPQTAEEFLRAIAPLRSERA
jgi:serine/threonine-protein kinase